MSWEEVDAWPGAPARGPAFRTGAEVVVAQRGPPTAGESLRLFWHSTPDHPFGAVARRVALTPDWLYVEARDRVRRRVRRDRIHGLRREAGRVVYAVVDGDDLVIADRKGDPLELALDAQVGAGGAWRAPHDALAYTVFGLIGLAGLVAALFCAWHYGPGGLESVRRGSLQSESALGLYAGVGGSFLALLFLTFMPQTYVADTVGLTSVWGMLRGIRTTVPRERIAAVVALVEKRRSRRYGFSYAYSVRLVLRDPDKTVELTTVGIGGEGERSQYQEQARQIARRLALMYGVEVIDRSGD